MTAVLLITALAYLAAIIIVGIPAFILKLVVVRSLGQGPEFSEKRLLKRSISVCLLAGFATTLAIIFSGRLTSPLWIPGVMPREAIAVATILLATIAAEAVVWYDRSVPAGLRTGTATAKWLLGSNLWLLWAIFLMFHFGSSNLETSCLFLDEIGAAADGQKCFAGPRNYWLAHPEQHLAVDALPISD
ncbi:MAG: hypothetical protein JNL25_09345 [Rhodospirillaceae bacterium]|nr:hypothetical protein [Rhodospirillaceae bacterium]